MIFKQLVVGSMGVCSYIIGCEKTKEAAIVDPGGEEKLLLGELENLGLHLKYIIATHGHPDHVCGNACIKEQTGADIVMHKDDAEFFSQSEAKEYFSMFGMTPSPPPDMCVSEGDTLEIGTVKCEIIHTPGHTPGGMCLYMPPHLITGDTLFVGGVGRTDFPGGAHATLMKSIKERIFPLPGQTIIWPGHGYGGLQSTVAEEKHSNPFLGGSL